jgi:hypothetical protein
MELESTESQGITMPTMTAMMVLFDSEIRDEIFMLLELAALKNYTHFVNLQGSSEHGKKEGTVSWPGSNEIMLLILSDHQKKLFSEEVNQFKKERTPKPGLLCFSWPLKDFI